MTPVIEVLLSNGDRADASTPDGAVYVARTLLDDLRRSNPTQGNDRGLYVMFATNGQHVRTVEAKSL